MLSADGTVISWNEGARRAKGYLSDEIIGRYFGLFYSEAEQLSGVPAKNLEIALRSGQFEGEGWRYRKDGSRFWAHVMIDTIRDEKKICHYLDIPIQHASDRILKRMGRRTSKQELIDIVGKLRKEIPDIVLRTTLITGFPGETEEDHEELKEFVDEMEFDRLGVFTYSPEEDTPAAEMADQIPEEVKEERRDELMELQQEISYDRGQDRIGQELLVMIEGKVADESAYIGRTYGDAPKVDGYIFVQTGELLMTGDFAKVRVTGALEYDLIGVLSDEYTE